MSEIANMVGAAAGLLSLVTVLATIGYAKRHAVATLQAHLEIMRWWAAGPAGDGWTDRAVRPIERLLWRCPQWSVIGLYSGQTLVGLSLLTNLVLSHSLVPPLAAVTQSVESFNAAVAKCDAFRLANIDRYSAVSWKMDRAIEKVLGAAVRPDETLTESQYDEIIKAAGLTGEETLWSVTLARLWQAVHVAHIGGSGGGGLHQKLRALSEAVSAHHGDV